MATPIQQMIEELNKFGNLHGSNMAKNFIHEEKNLVINAIMHALDEDGHTGQWKIEFANNYYDKLQQK